jgi:hypothetical protein
LLASLASERINYHPNFTCTRVPLGQASADSSGAVPKKARSSASRIEKLRQGDEVLGRAVDALRQGQMPAATPPSHPDMLFEYDFCTGERTYRIELIDYAGELVHVALSGDERAQRLRRQLGNMDALLVLAPAPWPEDDHEALDPDLLSLQGTFRLLCGERGETALKMPLAMIFSKWDRRSALEYRDPESESRELQRFLEQDPPPPHKTLFNTLRGAVADPANFKAFPISALGECRKVDIGDGQWAERPQSFRPLRAFGLEEPFIWAVQRLDDMDLESYRTNVARRRFSRFSGLLPWPFSLTRLAKEGQQLTMRFPSSDCHHSEARELWSQVRAERNRRSLSFAITLFVVVLMGEFSWSWVRYRQVEHIVGDPQATGPAVMQAESWLLDYAISSPLRHRVAKWVMLSSAEADAAIERLRYSREDLYKADISNTADAQARVEKARNYLNAFPNGRYQKFASEVVATVARQQQWEEFYRLYTDLLSEGKTVEASLVLQSRKGDSRIERLAETFEATALRYLDTEIKEKLSVGQIEEAYALHRQIGQWPLDLDIRSESGRREEVELLRTIKKFHDRELYDRARDYKTPSALSEYLELAPIGSMRQPVEKYIEWLESIDSVVQLELAVSRVRWGEETDKSDIEIEVKVNGEPAIKLVDLKGIPGSTSPLYAGKYSFSAKLNDFVEIDVSLKFDPWFGSGEMGEASAKVRVKELNGYTMKVSSGDFHNTVVFGLQGIKEQPKLPSWKNV